MTQEGSGKKSSLKDNKRSTSSKLTGKTKSQNPNQPVEETPSKSKKQSPQNKKSPKFSIPLKARSSSKNRDDIDNMLNNGNLAKNLNTPVQLEHANKTVYKVGDSDYQIRTQAYVNHSKSPFNKRKTSKTIEIEKWFPVGSKGRAVHRQKLVAQAIKTIDFFQMDGDQSGGRNQRYKTSDNNAPKLDNLSLSMSASMSKLPEVKPAAPKPKVKLAPLMGHKQSPDNQLNKAVLAPLKGLSYNPSAFNLTHVPS